MGFGISKDPSRLISGVILILAGLGQLSHTVTFSMPMTLVVAGILFIMEALSW